MNRQSYGIGDASYKAAGSIKGITRLVDAFYFYMDQLPEARRIRSMHQADLTESRKKLSYFLSGWLGGPKLYSQNFGSIAIPSAHGHLDIGRSEVEAWMLCMQKALAQQTYSDDFKVYLIEQLRVPAERIFVACEAYKKMR